MDGIIDASIESSDDEGWRELPRLEALAKIEQFQTEDLAAFEVVYGFDPTPVGGIETFTWLLTYDDSEQRPALLMLRDPSSSQVRWFIYADLVAD